MSRHIAAALVSAISIRLEQEIAELRKILLPATCTRWEDESQQDFANRVGRETGWRNFDWRHGEVTWFDALGKEIRNWSPGDQWTKHVVTGAPGGHYESELIEPVRARWHPQLSGLRQLQTELGLHLRDLRG